MLSGWVSSPRRRRSREEIASRSSRRPAGGPYWLGKRLSLVDLTYEPWFERIPALEHYRGVGLPAECPRLKAWAAAMMERPSVRSITMPLDYYIAGYRSYADGTEDGVTARDMRQM